MNNSIRNTINELRFKELRDIIPESSVTDLLAKRTELRNLFHGSNVETQDRQGISNVIMEISRELSQRAEAQQEKDGNSPVQNANRYIESGSIKRKQAIVAKAERNLGIEQETFNNLNTVNRGLYLHGYKSKPDPNTLTYKDFMPSSEE